MKRFFKYLGRTILAILGLLLLIVFLLYLPPVQDFLLRKAERYAASHYDLEVRIGHFRLGFPFDLVLDDVYAGKTAGDTLVAAEAIRLRVNIDRIFRKELGIEQLGLRQVKFGLAGDTTGMQLNPEKVKTDSKWSTQTEISSKYKQISPTDVLSIGKLA